jgi:hypothetical protein
VDKGEGADRFFRDAMRMKNSAFSKRNNQSICGASALTPIGVGATSLIRTKFRAERELRRSQPEAFNKVPA